MALGRSSIDGGGGDHMGQLGLVRRRHDHEIGQGRQIGDVERAGMGGAVGAHQAGAVHGEAHRQRLDRHVMHHLVIGALQEGGIDGAEGLHAFGRHAGGEGHAMLLGDADIEGAFREGLLEQIDAGARRHGGGDGDDARVLLGFRDQAFAEHFLIGRRLGRGLGFCSPVSTVNLVTA